MTFDPDAEPFLSLRVGSENGQTPMDNAHFFTGLTVDELAAVGMIASYAGQIEDHLAWILRWLIDGKTSATWIMTRELMSGVITQRIRDVMALPEWEEFSERWKVDDLLGGVKEAMKERNRVLHGGVSAASIVGDPTVLGCSERRTRQAMSGTAFCATHVMARGDLQKLAAHMWVIYDIVLNFHMEVMFEAQSRAAPATD